MKKKKVGGSGWGGGGGVRGCERRIEFIIKSVGSGPVGFCSVKTWLLIAYDTVFYAIINTWVLLC